MNPVNRIGVFVCECGDQIAGLVDIEAITQKASALPNVAWTGYTGYWCSPSGLERMKAIASEQHLDRVVIAGCAPRTHEAHFRQSLDGRVNPQLVGMINLRDLCARPHQADRAGAAEKASAQVMMAIADLAVSRAGASVLGEFPQFGVPAILVPYPYAWRYQKVNADSLTKQGAALMIEDSKLRSGLYLTIEKLLETPDKLDTMRSAMNALRSPNAAGKIAEQIFKLAGDKNG